jgi:hypothetical protein
MSTTFGIKIPSTGEIEPIARRVGLEMERYLCGSQIH